MTSATAISISGLAAKPQGVTKRIALSALVLVYSALRRSALACKRVLADARQLFDYVRGVHLLVLERIADPPSSTVRLLTLPAGSATFKMALVTPGLLEDHIVRDGYWAPHLMELMSVLMPANGVFIDVGANIGWHSLHLAALYPGARCHAFEPHPEIFRQLTRKTRLSSLRNLTLHRSAIGRTSRQGVFYMQEASSYNRGLSSAALQSDLKDNWREAVISFEPLDDALSNADRQAVSLIKIDTQGCEQDVLAGAQRTIAEARPAIILESESRYHADPAREIREVLSHLPGYEIFCLKLGSAELRSFDVEEVKDRRFEADLVCLPF